MLRTALHLSLSKPERTQPQGHLPVQKVMSSLLWLHPDPSQVSHPGPPTLSLLQLTRAQPSFTRCGNMPVQGCWSKLPAIPESLLRTHAHMHTHTDTQTSKPWALESSSDPFLPSKFTFAHRALILSSHPGPLSQVFLTFNVCSLFPPKAFGSSCEMIFPSLKLQVARGAAFITLHKTRGCCTLFKKQFSSPCCH